jgi:ATP-binding cassette, subfamily B, bacterial
MAANATTPTLTNALSRMWKVIQLDRREISAIYFFAILSGLIQLSLPLGIQSIISFVLGGAISTSLVVLIVFVVAGVFFAGLLQVNQMRMIEKVQQKIFVRYSFAFTDRIPRLQLQKVDSYFLPELVNRFFDTISLQKGISKLLLDLPAATIQIIFGLVLLSFYHSAFIIFGILIVLIVIVILRLTGAQGWKSSITESNYKYEVAGWLEELARTINSFKFSGNSHLPIRRTDKYTQGYLGARTKHFSILQIQYWSLIGFKVIITAAMLVVGSVLLVQQQLNIGQFIAAEIVILLVIGAVEKLIINLDNVYDVLTSLEKLGKVVDTPVEHEGEIDLVSGDKGLQVEVRNVSFHFDESNEDFVLKDISFTANANEKICIMGGAGAGKSTLIRLISGLFEDYKGNILLNQLPSNNYSLSSLRSQIGILFGDQSIFHGSLLENITMGKEDVPLNHIMDLGKRIGLQNILSQLPDGFNAMLDPNGKRISSKMKQKILLLRALVQNPKLLLLESPFDGMEAEAKESIMLHLLNKTNAQTVIVASNDEQFAQRCDKIILLKNGSIQAIGNWQFIQSQIAKP